MLRRVHKVSASRHPDLVVGLQDADDAGVIRLAAGKALVQSVDFFTPIVDEAYDWGRIAAANALSDVYAMGGTPFTALQLVAWPRDDLPLELLGEVIDGGTDVLAEAACTLLGGHSIDDPEPKYGFAITGLIDPERVVTNAAARPGDRLVLTKPIGTGVIATAIKADRAPAEVRDRAVEVMVALNSGAAQAMVAAGVEAATDVSGFGLLGHLGEMVRAAGVAARVEAAAVPIIEGAAELAAAGIYAGGSERNLVAAERFVDFENVPDATRRLLADAQTSGGLLMAVPPSRLEELLAGLEAIATPAAALVGELLPGPPGRIVVRG